MMLELPAGAHLLATGVVTPFMVPLKVTLFAAFVIASPYVIYQAWAFVAPGLYLNEKRFALPLLVSSILMFFLGMVYCYFVVFRVMFHFIVAIAPVSVTYSPDIESYFDTVIRLFLAFGLAFEVPIVVVLLVRTGIVGIERLRDVRRYVIVGAVVFGAIFAPPDVPSQLLLAIPMWLLFEVGLLVARMLPSGKPDPES
jgi:sec-independent protein translocase protein TatC